MKTAIVVVGLHLAVISGAVELRVSDFGARGDGQTDDGPAIQHALDALRRRTPPATLTFEKHRDYRIRTARDIWLFTLRDMRDFTLDGQGATFILDAGLRFIHMTRCTNATLRGFALDFDPLPFADGTIVAKNKAAGYVDVRIHDTFATPPPGGPTGIREQAYFAMIWNQGAHSLVAKHYYIKDLQPIDAAPRLVRAFAMPDFQGFADIHPGRTRISLPVRGVAHRMPEHGPIAAVVIDDNDSVLCEDMEIWSAPLFAVGVSRNRGVCTFRRFHIRPRPGTGRLTSVWRDGFHVKGNYARLLWEDCHLEGMNDDAFNIATHASRVVEAQTPTTLRIQQNYPLSFIPYREGDTLTAYSLAEGRRLGTTRVTGVVVEAPGLPAHSGERAPSLTITIDPALPAPQKNDLVWNASSANPDTTLRRCVILQSCRLQSPVTIEDCDITALCWFYGDNIEGPLPQNVIVRNSRLRQGRGNPQLAAGFTSQIRGPDGNLAPPREPVIQHVLLENNTWDGWVDIEYAENVTLSGNRFFPPRSRLRFHGSRNIRLENNFIDGVPLHRLEQITVTDAPARSAITFAPATNPYVDATGVIEMP